MSGPAESPRTPGAGGRPALPALLPVLVLLCGVGVVAVARSPSFPRPFLYALASAAGLRLLLGQDGRRLLPRPLLVALGMALSASSVAFLFDRLARGSAESLTALLAVVSVFQGLCLLGRQTAFSAFLLILLSSVHAAGGAIEYKDTTALWFILGYVVVLAWTLLLFERRIALERATEGGGATRRVRALGSARVPASSVARAIGALVLLGFPLGVLLYLAAPRHLQLVDLDAARAEREEVAEAEADVVPPAPFEGRGRVFATTGPGQGVPFGSVAEIQKDITAWFEVWEVGGVAGLREVVLRDNVQDYFDPATNTWRDTLSIATRVRRYRDRDDGRLDGWVDLGRGAAPAAGRTLRIELKLGGQRRLYLQPEPSRLRLFRDGRLQSGFEVSESANRTYAVGFPLREGDRIEQQFAPVPRDDAVLTDRRSDSSVSPPGSYLQVPERSRRALLARARAVVRGEPDPWTRARLLEAWLQSEEFTYTLRLPRLDPENPVVDFLESTRSSSCEGFALALTLMLRALGHPARYARGFWGGDPQVQRGSVILRGSHYHAWTEMYLDGVGWVPLNPTPPDRRPADADTFTVATGRADVDEADDEPFSFLGYDETQWRRFWSRIGGALHEILVAPLALLFSARAGYAGYPLLLLLLLWLVRHGRTRSVRRQVVARGQRLPEGPYGRALLMLGRKGLRRRPSQTARAFRRVAAQRFPAGATALGVLTRVHEDERYGGRMDAEARREASRALRDLRDALRKGSRPAAG